MKTIRQFVRAKRLGDCVVCTKTTPEIRKEIQSAQRSSRITVLQILEWLQVECNIKITPEQWQLHSRGHHR